MWRGQNVCSKGQLEDCDNITVLADQDCCGTSLKTSKNRHLKGKRT